MQATKCDRCGKYYDIDYEALCKIRITTVIAITAKEHYDLCPKCMAELKKWLTNFTDIIVDSSNLTADVCGKITTSVLKDIESGKGLKPILEYNRIY